MSESNIPEWVRDQLRQNQYSADISLDNLVHVERNNHIRKYESEIEDLKASLMMAQREQAILDLQRYEQGYVDQNLTMDRTSEIKAELERYLNRQVEDHIVDMLSGCGDEGELPPIQQNLFDIPHTEPVSLRERLHNDRYDDCGAIEDEGDDICYFDRIGL